jgi:RNA polymerase sigma factor (sigma-70 family)
MGSSHPDYSTISGYLAGDKNAWSAVEADIAAAFNAWRHKFGFETDDILSDIRYKLLVCLKRGDFGYRSSLRTYINRIVNHTCIDYLRYGRKFTATPVEDLPLSDESDNPEEALDRRQSARLLFRVMRQVPKECLRLWRMYLRQGLNCRAIGEIMGKTEGNIRRRLWACREAAKEIREKILRKDKPF